MEYYKLLQLDREPFSNSPDPEYFFNSKQHMGCLQKLELALRLKRGLNVVIGDVGTGKTTLCRQMIRNFADDADIETHLILDPAFESPTEFLHVILSMICSFSKQGLSHTEMKEMIKRSLFQSGVDADKTIILIIDEGQKISHDCLEILRELLNYETNTYKLLQIVIFAQLEFNAILKSHANFADRINLLHHLKPLRFTDTKQLILHRLKLSSATSKPTTLFTLPALWAVYRASRGYPRKIIHLCHQSILALIIQNQTKVGWTLIQSCKNRLSSSVFRKGPLLWTAALAGLAILLIVVLIPIFNPRNNPDSVPSDAAPGAFKIAPANEAMPDARQVHTAEEPPLMGAIPSEENAPPPTVGPAETIDQTEPIVALRGAPFRPSDGQEREPESSPRPLQHPSPPENLGELVVKPGDTLSIMTLKVYGRRHHRFLRSVIAANPHIKDPNDIDIGHIILFPSVIQKPDIPKTPFYMVLLDAYDNLKTAMQRLENFSPALESKPMLVSSWSPSHGLRFQIIEKKYFSSQQAARTHINMIPHAIAARSEILPGWPEGTIFYSNPFPNNASLSFKARVEIEE